MEAAPRSLGGVARGARSIADSPTPRGHAIKIVFQITGLLRSYSHPALRLPGCRGAGSMTVYSDRKLFTGFANAALMD